MKLSRNYITLHEDYFEYNASKSITTPKELAELYMSLGYHLFDRERAYVALLNTKGCVVGFEEISVGNINMTFLNPREVYKMAILTSAVGVIVCHNHPSGDLTPSQEDIESTKRLEEAGDILGINLYDHIIISPKGDWCSLRQEGQLL